MSTRKGLLVKHTLFFVMHLFHIWCRRVNIKVPRLTLHFESDRDMYYAKAALKTELPIMYLDQQTMAAIDNLGEQDRIASVLGHEIAFECPRYNLRPFGRAIR